MTASPDFRQGAPHLFGATLAQAVLPHCSALRTVSRGASLADALLLLSEGLLHALPVLDDGGALVDVISCRDVRHLASQSQTGDLTLTVEESLRTLTPAVQVRHATPPPPPRHTAATPRNRHATHTARARRLPGDCPRALPTIHSLPSPAPRPLLTRLCVCVCCAARRTQRLHTCAPTDSLLATLPRLANAETAQLVCVDERGAVVGVVTSMAILTGLLTAGPGPAPTPAGE